MAHLQPKRGRRSRTKPRLRPSWRRSPRQNRRLKSKRRDLARPFASARGFRRPIRSRYFLPLARRVRATIGPWREAPTGLRHHQFVRPAQRNGRRASDNAPQTRPQTSDYPSVLSTPRCSTVVLHVGSRNAQRLGVGLSRAPASLAIFAAMRRASSFVSSLAADRRRDCITWASYRYTNGCNIRPLRLSRPRLPPRVLARHLKHQM